MPHPKLGHCTQQSLLQVYMRRAILSFLAVIVAYCIAWLVFTLVNPNEADLVKRIQSSYWTMTSHSWLDRISCRHLGICGGYSWLISTLAFYKRRAPSHLPRKHDHRQDWFDNTIDPDTWNQSELESRSIPDYVFDHAPFIYLHENENWWPSDVADFLYHVRHTHSGRIGSENATLSNMENLLKWDEMPGENFLESDDDPELSPDWLLCAVNKPGYSQDYSGSMTTNLPSPSLQQLDWTQYLSNIYGWLRRWLPGQKNFLSSAEIANPTEAVSNSMGGRAEIQARLDAGQKSAAPAFLITVNKPNETIDAFWFFFYAFNRGARVTGIQYGNHVGDWEHVLVRFQNGKPTQTYLSAHEWGSAYGFDALEKHEVFQARPIVYAGLGSHANYATPGKHSYALPFGLLGDSCNRGTLWDPTQNLLSYVHHPERKDSRQPAKFLASSRNPWVRTSFLYYRGHWGDLRYSLGDRFGRNYRFAGEYKYLSGPTGPWDKALQRDTVCEHADKPCVLRDSKHGYVGPIRGTSEIESFGS